MSKKSPNSKKSAPKAQSPKVQNTQNTPKPTHRAIQSLPKKSQALLQKSGLVSRYVVVDVLGVLLQNSSKKSTPNHTTPDTLLGADTLINTHPDFVTLPPRDRAFARHILMTTLRTLPYVQQALADKIPRTPKPAVQNVLQTAVVQLFFMATPAHGVVSSALHLLDALGQGKAKGLANAVLRHITSDYTNPADLPPQYTTPQWFWDMLVADYGTETATQIANAHTGTPPLDITVKSDVHHWADVLGGDVFLPDYDCGQGSFGGTVRLTNTGDITQLPHYTNGDWWVQDGGATLPAKILAGAFTDGLQGKHIADVCSAPGGKTMQLIQAGATVTALDDNPQRLNRLHENLKRTGLSATVQCTDATTHTPTQKYHGTLVDAPCSATGTIRRHPELPYLKQESDFQTLPPLQQEILKNAVNMTQSGGYVVYATCSLRHAEGEEITNWATQNLPLTIAPITQDELTNIAPNTPLTPQKDGTIRTHPHHQTDGFYIARFKIK